MKLNISKIRLGNNKWFLSSQFLGYLNNDHQLQLLIGETPINCPEGYSCIDIPDIGKGDGLLVRLTVETLDNLTTHTLTDELTHRIIEPFNNTTEIPEFVVSDYMTILKYNLLTQSTVKLDNVRTTKLSLPQPLTNLIPHTVCQ